MERPFNLQQHVVNHILYQTELANPVESYMNNLTVEDLIYQSAESNTQRKFKK